MFSKGQTVLNVIAIDKDNGINSSIYYSLTGVPVTFDGEPIFSIDRNSGKFLRKI